MKTYGPTKISGDELLESLRAAIAELEESLKRCKLEEHKVPILFEMIQTYGVALGVATSENRCALCGDINVRMGLTWGMLADTVTCADERDRPTIEDDRAEMNRQSAEAYKRALCSPVLKEDPYQWGMVHNNFGATLVSCARVAKTKTEARSLVTQAIEALEGALRIWDASSSLPAFADNPKTLSLWRFNLEEARKLRWSVG